MGIFDKLFGSKKQDPPLTTQPTEEAIQLQEEYNVMSSIELGTSEKYNDSTSYRLVENSIYEDLNDTEYTKFRMVISYILEGKDFDDQYPLEDILDKYLIHVSDHLEAEINEGSCKFKIELAGDLEALKSAQEIIGKKVFNRDFINENGQVGVDLVIQ